MAGLRVCGHGWYLEGRAIKGDLHKDWAIKGFEGRFSLAGADLFETAGPS